MVEVEWTEDTDVLQVLEVYQRRLAEFKREMEALGIKVKVSASIDDLIPRMYKKPSK